jgi:hypothetical protein
VIAGAGGQYPICSLLVNALIAPQSSPQIVGGGKRVQVVVPPGQKIVLDDAAPIRCVGELEAKNLRVFLRLL